MNVPLFISFILVLALTACGGGGGSSGGVASGTLGKRTVPGGSIAVAKVGTIATGAPATFRITVSSAVAPNQVLAWIGAEYDPNATGTAASLEAGSTNVYSVTLTIPATIDASTHVWIRLIHADGSVIETGADDFSL